MMTVVKLLSYQLGYAFNLVQKAMADVDDSMLHWEPVPHSWGLRFRSGCWMPDYDKLRPIPAGPKTIGWLAAHLAGCKEMYFEYAFGAAKKTWEELAIPGDAKGLNKYLVDAQEALIKKLENIKEYELDRHVPTNWGEKKPIWWIYWIMIYHDVEHGGQIIQVKNEYKNRE